MKQIKILTINITNKSGSTGKIIQCIEDSLSSSKFSFWHLYAYGESSKNASRYCHERERNIYRKLAYITGNKFGIGKRPLYRIKKEVEKIQPDIIHLHCPNSNTVDVFGLLQFIKKKNIALVVTLHAEFFYTGCCDHAYECEKWKSGCGKCPNMKEANRSFLFDRTHNMWLKMKKSFVGFKSIEFVSVSEYVDTRFMVSPVCGMYRHRIIQNGVDTTVFNKKGTDNRKDGYIFHVTANFSDRIDDPKGGHWIIKLAKRNSNIHFIIAASNSQVLELPTNVTLLGNVDNQIQLANLYSNAMLTVITSKRETYSMVCAESLCCGTPVVGFKAGGPESIAIHRYSEFCANGDIEALNSIINKWLNYKKDNNTYAIADEACQRYSQDTMAKCYGELYEKLVSNN